MDNVPEYVFWMGGAALAGAVVVGGNPTHRGDELARDLSHTECQLLVTNAAYRQLVEGHDLGPALPARAHPGRRRPLAATGRPVPPPTARCWPAWPAAPCPTRRRSGSPRTASAYLLFTSGTSGAPKACLCSQGRLARIGAIVAQMFELDRRTTSATWPCPSSTPTP